MHSNSASASAGNVCIEGSKPEFDTGKTLEVTEEKHQPTYDSNSWYEVTDDCCFSYMSHSMLKRAPSFPLGALFLLIVNHFCKMRACH
jgi:hypothetical protein